MTTKYYDVILVGGGVMGCATAYHLLKADPQLKVAIVEKDPSYEKSSTILSDGNLRVQFNIKENIQMSLYGLKVLEHFSEEMAVGDNQPEVMARQQGNLFLIDTSGEEEARRGLALQQSLGGDVVWVTPEEIGTHFPGCEPPADIVGGTLGRRDGSLDPWAVLMAYKKKAVALGAHFIVAEVASLLAKDGRMTGVRLASGEELAAGVVVNTAGAWAARLAQTVGVDLPVQPVRRQVFLIETPLQPEGFLPSLFLPSGLYLIQEHGGRFMCGKSLPDDPVGIDFQWDRQLFVERLWPELFEFIPIFDRLKVTGGWAGLYAVNTFDGNAILGEWPECKGLYLANGFSGHGFQQCFAVGRYLAELILGQTPFLDLSVFSPRRILENRPVFESERKLI
ncbi:MAG: FAD-binding oxidoreductase [Chloroflexi bacterium]|nr:FAD-binding oxidoreductase [Chloroflexota bacterium]